MKTIRIFHLKAFIFFVVNFSIYLNRCVFVMKVKKCYLKINKYLIRIQNNYLVLRMWFNRFYEQLAIIISIIEMLLSIDIVN